MKKISFRQLKIEDLPLVCLWLNKSHVKKWYGNTSVVTLDNIRKKLLPRIQGEEAVFCYLILLDEKPIGYIQWYDAWAFPREGYHLDELKGELCDFSTLAALDLYIGEENLIGQGIGSIAIRQFVHEVIYQEGYEACYADPELDNFLSVNAFKKAGFKALRTIKTENNILLQAMTISKNTG